MLFWLQGYKYKQQLVLQAAKLLYAARCHLLHMSSEACTQHSACILSWGCPYMQNSASTTSRRMSCSTAD
jgi:hypothetical protein